MLQTQAADHFEIISQMAKLLDFIAVPAARASILWLIGEYNEKVPKIAPDVLRKLAKTFTDEVSLLRLLSSTGRITPSFIYLGGYRETTSAEFICKVVPHQCHSN